VSPERWRAIATALLLVVLSLGAILTVGFVRAPAHPVAAPGARASLQAERIVSAPPRNIANPPTPSAPPHFAPPSPCEAARTAALQAARAQLRPDAAADQAFNAALLDDVLAMQSLDSPDEDVWQQARARWPDDLDIAWLAARNCHAPHCDEDAALDHLLALDGDNAAAWMLAMDTARGRGDATAYAALLHRAAAARIYDARVGVVFVHLQPLFAAMPTISCARDDVAVTHYLGHPPSHLEWAAAEASTMELAFEMPGVGALSDCRPVARAMPAAQRADCLALARRLAAADTLLEHIVGLSLVVQLSPDGPQRDEARERYRQAHWLLFVAGRLPQEHSIDPWLQQGEVNRLQARATAAGLWPPPPDWLPAGEQARALVLTGNVEPSR